MDPITLLLGAGALLLFLGKKEDAKNKDATQKHAPSLGEQLDIATDVTSINSLQAQADKITTQVADRAVDIIAGVEGAIVTIAAAPLGAFAPVAGAAMAGASKAGGYVGGRITGDAAGKIVGAINPVHGTAFNTGRYLGKEVDKALGSTGDDLTGIIAQVAGGELIVLVVLVGPMALLTLPLWALAYIIGGMIEDEYRLGYGPGGAKRDYEKGFAQVYDRVFETLTQGGETFSAIDALQAKTLAIPFANGFMRARDWQARQQYMSMSHGHVGDKAWEEAGLLRGYFVGGFTYAKDITYADGYKLHIDAQWSLAPLQQSEVHGAIQQRIATAMDKAGQHVTSALGEVTWTKPYAAGERAGVLASYLNWMRHPRGIGVTDIGHLKYGMNEGRVAGTLDSPLGRSGDIIIYRGESLNWRDYK